MKKNIITIASGLLFASALFAQSQDSLLRRQMELERDFNPTLLDANKINTLPALHEPNVRKANTNYSTWTERTSPSLEIAIPRPSTIATAVEYNRKNGYLSFTGGNYANMNGAAGYKILSTERNNLQLDFRHLSTNGTIRYIQPSEPADHKAYIMDNEGALQFDHLFNAFSLTTALGYSHSQFNYYGNTFGMPRFFNDENQQVGVFHLQAGFESREARLMNYIGGIEYKNFSTKYAGALNDGGIAGNQVRAHLNLSKPFIIGTDNKIGIDGKYWGTFYKGPLNNFSLLNASPYVFFKGANWSTHLGAAVLIKIDGKAAIRVAPDVDLKVMATEHSSLYANIKGGYSNNTFLDIFKESRYVFPMLTVRPAFTLLDLTLGTHIGEVNGFKFDIFGGYKKTDDEHFLVLSENNNSSALPNAPLNNEYLVPRYADLSHSHVGGAVQTNIWAPLNAMLRIKKNIYKLQDAGADEKAYNKPGIELDVRADYEVMRNLKVMLNYYFAADRWTHYKNEVIKMDNINDLNLGAVYEINESFSINLNANNLLSQQYDIWYGYPSQRINVMGGFSFKF